MSQATYRFPWPQGQLLNPECPLRSILSRFEDESGAEPLVLFVPGSRIKNSTDTLLSLGSTKGLSCHDAALYSGAIKFMLMNMWRYGSSEDPFTRKQRAALIVQRIARTVDGEERHGDLYFFYHRSQKALTDSLVHGDVAHIAPHAAASSQLLADWVEFILSKGARGAEPPRPPPRTSKKKSKKTNAAAEEEEPGNAPPSSSTTKRGRQKDTGSSSSSSAARGGAGEDGQGRRKKRRKRKYRFVDDEAEASDDGDEEEEEEGEEDEEDERGGGDRGGGEEGDDDSVGEMLNAAVAAGHSMPPNTADLMASMRRERALFEEAMAGENDGEDNAPPPSSPLPPAASGGDDNAAAEGGASDEKKDDDSLSTYWFNCNLAHKLAKRMRQKKMGTMAGAGRVEDPDHFFSRLISDGTPAMWNHLRLIPVANDIEKCPMPLNEQDTADWNELFTFTTCGGYRNFCLAYLFLDAKTRSLADPLFRSFAIDSKSMDPDSFANLRVKADNNAWKNILFLPSCVFSLRNALAAIKTFYSCRDDDPLVQPNSYVATCAVPPPFSDQQHALLDSSPSSSGGRAVPGVRVVTVAAPSPHYPAWFITRDLSHPHRLNLTKDPTYVLDFDASTPEVGAVRKQFERAGMTHAQVEQEVAAFLDHGSTYVDVSPRGVVEMCQTRMKAARMQLRSAQEAASRGGGEGALAEARAKFDSVASLCCRRLVDAMVDGGEHFGPSTRALARYHCQLVGKNPESVTVSEDYTGEETHTATLRSIASAAVGTRFRSRFDFPVFATGYNHGVLRDFIDLLVIVFEHQKFDCKHVFGVQLFEAALDAPRLFGLPHGLTLAIEGATEHGKNYLVHKVSSLTIPGTFQPVNYVSKLGNTGAKGSYGSVSWTDEMNPDLLGVDRIPTDDMATVVAMMHPAGCARSEGAERAKSRATSREQVSKHAVINKDGSRRTVITTTVDAGTVILATNSLVAIGTSDMQSRNLVVRPSIDHTLLVKERTPHQIEVRAAIAQSDPATPSVHFDVEMRVNQIRHLYYLVAMSTWLINIGVLDDPSDQPLALMAYNAIAMRFDLSHIVVFGAADGSGAGSRMPSAIKQLCIGPTIVEAVIKCFVYGVGAPDPARPWSAEHLRLIEPFLVVDPMTVAHAIELHDFGGIRVMTTIASILRTKFFGLAYADVRDACDRICPPLAADARKQTVFTRVAKTEFTEAGARFKPLKELRGADDVEQFMPPVLLKLMRRDNDLPLAHVGEDGAAPGFRPYHSSSLYPRAPPPADAAIDNDMAAAWRPRASTAPASSSSSAAAADAPVSASRRDAEARKFLEQARLRIKEATQRVARGINLEMNRFYYTITDYFPPVCDNTAAKILHLARDLARNAWSESYMEMQYAASIVALRKERVIMQISSEGRPKAMPAINFVSGSRDLLIHVRLLSLHELSMVDCIVHALHSFFPPSSENVYLSAQLETRSGPDKDPYTHMRRVRIETAPYTGGAHARGADEKEASTSFVDSLKAELLDIGAKLKEVSRDQRPASGWHRPDAAAAMAEHTDVLRAHFSVFRDPEDVPAPDLSEATCALALQDPDPAAAPHPPPPSSPADDGTQQGGGGGRSPQPASSVPPAAAAVAASPPRRRQGYKARKYEIFAPPFVRLRRMTVLARKMDAVYRMTDRYERTEGIVGTSEAARVHIRLFMDVYERVKDRYFVMLHSVHMLLVPVDPPPHLAQDSALAKALEWRNGLQRSFREYVANAYVPGAFDLLRALAESCAVNSNMFARPSTVRDTLPPEELHPGTAASSTPHVHAPGGGGAHTDGAADDAEMMADEMPLADICGEPRLSTRYINTSLFRNPRNVPALRKLRIVALNRTESSSDAVSSSSPSPSPSSSSSSSSPACLSSVQFDKAEFTRFYAAFLRNMGIADPSKHHGMPDHFRVIQGSFFNTRTKAMAIKGKDLSTAALELWARALWDEQSKRRMFPSSFGPDAQVCTYGDNLLTFPPGEVPMRLYDMGITDATVSEQVNRALCSSVDFAHFRQCAMPVLEDAALARPAPRRSPSSSSIFR